MSVLSEINIMVKSARVEISPDRKSFRLAGGQTLTDVSKDSGYGVDAIVSANGGLVPEKYLAGKWYSLPYAATGQKKPHMPKSVTTPLRSGSVIRRGPSSTEWNPNPPEPAHHRHGVAWTCPYGCGEKYYKWNPNLPPKEQAVLARFLKANIVRHYKGCRSNPSYTPPKSLEEARSRVNIRPEELGGEQ